MVDRLNTALAGQYVVQRELGRGGMATVYLADDLKHRRQVAIKVLHPELAVALGPERFLREIEIAAGLAHPHILPVHDSGQADGFLYYVMPFVDGESLRDRLDRERELSLEDTIRIAREVADGLSYAHAQGVVHRDIKPGNILLSGTHALIADFGIARAVSAAGATDLTETGLSLGTPQYMSPEQASGSHQLDARTDQYALACVVYEMLAGEPPHTGANAQAIIANILTQPVPQLREVRDTVPPRVEYAVAKALANLPADRFSTVAEFAEILHDDGGSAWAPAAAGPSAAARLGGSVVTWQSAFGVAVLVALVALWAPWRPPVTPDPVVRFSVNLPPGQMIDWFGPAPPVVVSPDGSRFVYVVSEEGTRRLFQRPLDGMVGTPIRGTEGARGPFFSPDGNWVGFFTGNRLRKVSLLGGAPQDIAEVEGTRSGSWGTDGTIVLGAPDRVTGDRENLERVSEEGGAVEGMSSLEFYPALAQEFHWAPEMLPGNQAVLFTAWGLADDSVGVAVRSVDSGEQRVLIRGGMHPRYLPDGYLLYAQGTDLFALRFDPERLEVRGEAVAILEGVGLGIPEWPSFSVSRDGTLTYVSVGSGADFLSLVWVDRSGTLQSIVGIDDLDLSFQSPRVSPDGEHILFMSEESFWTYDEARGIHERVTDDSGQDYWAVWTPNGDSVLFNSIQIETGSIGLYSVPSSGGEPGESLTPGLTFASPQSVARDRGLLAMLGSQLGEGLSSTDAFVDPETGQDVWVLDLRGDRTPRPFLNSSADEFHPMFSADGRWLAYASNHSGRQEVYVRPFPGPGRPTQLSSDGGGEPIWSPTQPELYYRSIDGRSVLGVPFRLDNAFVPEAPRLLFEGPFAPSSGLWGRNYDISPDGERFLMIRMAESSRGLREFQVVLNLGELVRKKMSAQGGQ